MESGIFVIVVSFVYNHLKLRITVFTSPWNESFIAEEGAESSSSRSAMFLHLHEWKARAIRRVVGWL